MGRAAGKRTNANGEIMSGSIHQRADSKAFFVLWYDEKTRRQYKIYRYRGVKMFDKRTASKLLAQMQGEAESGTFCLENYIGDEVDTVKYLQTWFKAVRPNLAPATAKGYESYIRCHLKPYFKAHPVPLRHVRLDVLTDLLNWLPLTGKGKQNVMYCLHACLDYAWRSGRIAAVPPFPRKREYQIQEPVIKWLPSDRQTAILNAIPAEHAPIFWFLKYHMRRPAEALALHREDYSDGVFTIRRSISARRLVESTKTHHAHLIPCHDDFLPWLERALRAPIISPYLFTHSDSKLPGKRYSHEVLNRIWRQACAAVGESIDLYSGLKHSTVTQYAVEHGYSDSQLQMITDHARIDSVRKYRAQVIEAKRRLLHGEVVELKKKTATE